MKYLIIILSVFLSSCLNGQNKKQEINYLQQFYKSYSDNWENDDALNFLKKKNLSKELIINISKANASGLLDYDPLINAQDLNEEFLKTLKINYKDNIDLYEISYKDNYNKKSRIVYLKLIKNENLFKISDIKVNSIESINKINNPKKNKINSTNNLKNDLQIEVRGKDIYINNFGKEYIYKNFIINEMSVQTTLKNEKNNLFSLNYEYNASQTKMKEQYKFCIKSDGLYLYCKEVVKFDSKGIAINRIYYSNYSIKNRTYENIQELGSKLKFNFTKKDVTSYLFNTKNSQIGYLSFKASAESFFIDYPEVNIENVTVDNIDEVNDVAYYLEQSSVFKESVYLLKEILKKDAQRVVAWLNMADAQWGANNKIDAKVSYQKYLALMKSQGKDLSKIPTRVYDRIK